MARTRRHSMARRGTSPKRDVTWGFSYRALIIGANSLSAEWVFAPSRATPDGALVVPNAPADITLIRTLPVFFATKVIPNTGNAVQPMWLGLISWSGVDAGTPPTELPLASDGAWDWVWRAPLLFGAPNGAGAISDVQTYPAPVWTDIHSMRKMGEDQGLLLVVDNTLSAVEAVLQYDIRYAFKFPW